MKIEEGIEEFLKELKTRGRSPFTVNHYRGHLRRFTRWLERRETGKRPAGDPSLNLDLGKIQVTIRFRKSSSPYFKEAVRVAKGLPVLLVLQRLKNFSTEGYWGGIESGVNPDISPA